MTPRGACWDVNPPFPGGGGRNACMGSNPRQPAPADAVTGPAAAQRTYVQDSSCCQGCEHRGCDWATKLQDCIAAALPGSIQLGHSVHIDATATRVGSRHGEVPAGQTPGTVGRAGSTRQPSPAAGKTGGQNNHSRTRFCGATWSAGLLLGTARCGAGGPAGRRAAAARGEVGVQGSQRAPDGKQRNSLLCRRYLQMKLSIN
jgi:hypothetical protein